MPRWGLKKYFHVKDSVADPGFLSRIRIFSIPDLGSGVKKIPDPGSGSASKNLSILTQKKIVSVHPGSGSRFRILILLPIPDPGTRGQKGTGSRIRILNTG
jgi:hypothetical protein